MRTEVISIDPLNPAPAAIARATNLLRAGSLVAFPTETVYGVGANAADSKAVERIFFAKGRPARNPLIIHVATIGAARRLVSSWPDVADRLARRFWPGALTLVLQRGVGVADEAAAGGATIALRIPNHPSALALIESFDGPIAAPSANRSETVSPTCAEHVLATLSGRIELVLDGGPTTGGLESTVLDLTTDPVRLLRPGLISPAALREIVADLDARPVIPGGPHPPLPSPGMLFRHYAPSIPVELAGIEAPERVRQLVGEGVKVGWLTFVGHEIIDRAVIVALAANPDDYSRRLYSALHLLDRAGLNRIVVSRPPQHEDWLAVHDRLTRAAESG